MGWLFFRADFLVIYLYEKMLGLYLVVGGIFFYLIYREKSLRYFFRVFLAGMTFLRYLSSGFLSSSLLKMGDYYLGEQT